MSIHLDSKGIAIDKLSTNFEGFEMSMGQFPKKSAVQAIHELERLEFNLFLFAHDPTMTAKELPLPEEPDTSNLNDEEANQRTEEFRKLKELFNMKNESSRLKVHLDDYIVIKKFTNTFRQAIHVLPAVKGQRFKSLTKNTETEKKGGIAAALGFGEKE